MITLKTILTTRLVTKRSGVEDTRLKAKDSPSVDRLSRGQRQECSRPRTEDTNASALKKKNLQKIFSGDLQKKGLQKNFQVISNKNGLEKIFSANLQNFNPSKTLLSSSRGQGNYRGLEASRPMPRTSKCVLEAKDVLEDSTSGN